MFASAAQAAEAFISDGITVHARKARDPSVRRFGGTFGCLAGWAAAPPPERAGDIRGVAVRLDIRARPVSSGSGPPFHSGGYRP